MSGIFKTLYGIDKFNKIKEWKIKVQDNKDHSVIIYSYGYLDGKKVECKIIKEAGKNIGKKNETTHFQQAMLEAEAKWKRKRDIDGYDTCLENANRLLEQQKSDIPQIPMLAQDYKRFALKVKFPCFVQPKLDGYRMIYNPCTRKMTTRTGKDYSILYNTELHKELQSIDCFLDGELYVHDPDFKFENLGVLRKQKMLIDEERKVLNTIEYHVYDILGCIDNESGSMKDFKPLEYEERLSHLKSLFQRGSFKKIKFVETLECGSSEQIREFHNHFVSQGYEGSIVRNKSGIYRCKFRSFDLLKYKDFDDAEFEIIDFTHETDKTGSGKRLIVWVCKTETGKTFNVRPKGTELERQQLYSKGKDYIGRKLWVKFFGLTENGIPRFPSTARNAVKDYIRDTLQ